MLHADVLQMSFLANVVSVHDGRFRGRISINVKSSNHRRVCRFSTFCSDLATSQSMHATLLDKRLSNSKDPGSYGGYSELQLRNVDCPRA